jgi:hypothetical protein
VASVKMCCDGCLRRPWPDAALPLLAAAVGVIGAFASNLYFKRREEKTELRAVARLLDGELAAMEGSLDGHPLE